ncbi:MAG: hypothetical protein HQM02_00870 [Magnetococcales bacterium]|nr:hypothetical protein [Magnetococcales bacterium]
MPNHHKHFTLMQADPEEQKRIQEDPYWQTREKVFQLLLQYTLIESYRKFVKKRVPYPFVTPAMVRPGAISATKEHALHNTCLITLLDAALPDKLRKHFRCREGNQVTKANIADVAPDLPNLDNYNDLHKDASHEGFNSLLRMLLPLDYSLLIQNCGGTDPVNKKMALSNFHVRIERLTDNALRNLGIHLNYLERSLYEKGDAFIEMLEKKFFEYYNFYHNAGGRRAAAAHAAQLLFREKLPGTIFVGSQQDRRLTLLTTDGIHKQTVVEQFFFVKLENEIYHEFIAFGKKIKKNVKKNYLFRPGHKSGLAILRAEYEHTTTSQPSQNALLRDENEIQEKWVRLKEEAIIPLVPGVTDRIGYSFAYRGEEQKSDLMVSTKNC